MNSLKLITLFLSFFLIACNGNQSVANQEGDGVVDVEKFADLIQPSCQLIDVRTPQEFAKGHIPKAVNIDYKNADFKSQINILDTSKPVLLYCHSGGRSAKSYKILKEKGFKEVYDLQGGFTAWSKAKKDIAK